MSFDDLTTDKVTLVKADGTLIKENIKAQVSPGKIITFDKTLPLQPNDHLLRPLPNGLVEDYIVTDPGYFAGIHGIEGHFQAKVRRSDAPVATAQTSFITSPVISTARIPV
ncbi:hypothetical protein HFO98_34965 [Rhizobium leguminosarum]|uniref:hypothetical protein n=1 Tax=Rhizobium leguminosarum TaxID=384 RepID=UPI001C958397|nr:hypothetical protein [Rhizobium leguminosarum]MBY5413501.1 hypothetical protein [Rhizobium leguminosarum]